MRGELELYGGSNVCEQPPSSHRLVICVHRQDGSQRTSDAMHGLPDVHGRDFRQAQGAAAFTFAHDKIVKIERISARDRLRRVEAEGMAGR
ncbi:hypothetical protein ACIHFD_65405 [Nonomuraea sp. NPDC051941]|uniref:hypothetical protein n=1 Tax=Nonomuraea sp. NPDC051941 TaxID=3364373 RepID=UPI0037CBBC04